MVTFFPLLIPLKLFILLTLLFFLCVSVCVSVTLFVAENGIVAQTLTYCKQTIQHAVCQ